MIHDTLGNLLKTIEFSKVGDEKQRALENLAWYCRGLVDKSVELQSQKPINF